MSLLAEQRAEKEVHSRKCRNLKKYTFPNLQESGSAGGGIGHRRLLLSSLCRYLADFIL